MKSVQPQPATALAAKTGANPDALHRVMRARVNHGVFALENGRFSHNAASQALRSDHPASMRALARMMGMDFHWDAFRELGYSLKTGESAAHKAVSGGIFEHLQTHPDDGRIFNDAMIGKSFAQIGPLLGSYDFTPYKTIGDIGGGVGHLLTAILDAAPDASGVLFELPEVIEQARASSNPRVTWVAGDFFRDAIPDSSSSRRRRWPASRASARRSSPGADEGSRRDRERTGPLSRAGPLPNHFSY